MEKNIAQRLLFGTDGIRGKANIFPVTGEIAFQLGRAVTYYFQQKLSQSGKSTIRPKIIVGKDTRLSCYMLEQAFSSGVCAQGGEVILTGPIPTPAVAFLIDSMRACAGVMISASHNPYGDNGIKIFDHYGRKLSDEVEKDLEQLVLNNHLVPLQTDGALGRAKRLDEVFGRYIVYVKSAFNKLFSLEGKKIVIDCAHGAAYKLAPIVFQELGAEVVAIGINPNGQNINDGVGALYPEIASKVVIQEKADLGICLDGDGDRLVIINHLGEIIQGDVLLAFLCRYFLDLGVLQRGDEFVGTSMTNLGLELLLKDWGVTTFRANVGDRYILERLLEKNGAIGGEPSGHVILRNHSYTGDGILASLKVLEAMLFYQKPLALLVKNFTMASQFVANVTVEKKIPLHDLEYFQKSLNNIKEKLSTKGRVVVRYSGTESLLRIMIEGILPDKELQESLNILEKSFLENIKIFANL